MNNICFASSEEGFIPRISKIGRFSFDHNETALSFQGLLPLNTPLARFCAPKFQSPNSFVKGTALKYDTGPVWLSKTLVFVSD